MEVAEVVGAVESVDAEDFLIETGGKSPVSLS